MRRLDHFIDGKDVAPAGGAYFDDLEPATGQAHLRVAEGNEEDVRRAVDAAARAFPAWSRTSAEERSRVLLRMADLIERDLEAFARAESIDTGKPIALAREVDIPRSVANFRFFGTAILHGESAAHDTDGRAINYTLRRARGVAGLISPWNLPLYLLSWKIAPALATGNTAVCKPSELTPLTAGMLGGVAREAGLPAGVLNIVHGTGARVGAPLVAHPDVPTISFTGGTATGRHIAVAAGERFKRVSLELGGKNAVIVLDDADIDQAVETSIASSFRNQGQICLCGSRILVQEGVYERFAEGFLARAGALRVGDPLEASTTHGALISREHADKVERAVDLAVSLGGHVACGGRRPRVEELPARCRGGSFYLPTVLTGLDPHCRVEQEEIFGPVVTLARFAKVEQAVGMANSTPYGLAGVVWTRDVTRAHEVSAMLDVGIVWVNCWMLRDLRTPFGGMKQSGVGREGGNEAIRFFTEAKNVCVKLGKR